MRGPQVRRSSALLHTHLATLQLVLPGRASLSIPSQSCPTRYGWARSRGHQGTAPQCPPGHCALPQGSLSTHPSVWALCPAPSEPWGNLFPKATWTFPEDSGEQLQNLTSKPVQEQVNPSWHFRVKHHGFTILRSVFRNGAEPCKLQGKDCCMGHWHQEGCGGSTQDPRKTN